MSQVSLIYRIQLHNLELITQGNLNMSEENKETLVSKHTNDSEEKQQQHKQILSNEIERVVASIDSIDTRIESLTKIVEARLSYDKTKEMAFDRLYDELDDLKQNRMFDFIRPMFIDLILLFDRFDNTKKSLQENASIEKTLNSFEDELLEILYRRDVEIIKLSGEIFNKKYQLALETEETSDKSKNNQIARVVRRGFKSGERVIRPEEVIIYKFKVPVEQVEDINSPKDDGLFE